MRILFLCPYDDTDLFSFMADRGDEVIRHDGRVDADFLASPAIDWIVSYGYKHIIRADVLAVVSGRAINLHISYLPWNRGYHPNLWSFYDDTPKGVTIHFIDPGIDTGDIVAQRELRFSPDDTLASSYSHLRRAVESLFREAWPAIRDGTAPRQPQRRDGSHHYRKDLERISDLLSEGWDTPVSKIAKAGAERRSAGSASAARQP